MKLPFKKDNRPWTPEEERLLKDEWVKGISAHDLSVLLNRAVPSIWSKTAELSLPSVADRLNEKLEDPTFQAELKELYLGKDSIATICGKLHIKLPFLYRAIDALKIPRRNKQCVRPVRRFKPKEYTPEEVETVRKLRETRTPIETIAKQFGTTYGAIRSLCSRNGISTSTLWTKGDDKKLKDLLIDDRPPEEICEILDRTPFSLKWRCETLGILKRFPQIKKFVSELIDKQPQTVKSLLSQRLASCKMRKSKAGDLTIEDLLKMYEKQRGKCCYTGIPLTLDSNDPDVLSLDRIDSSKGYTVNNVALCTWDVNRMKQDISVERFKYLCGLIVDHSNLVS